jgi:cytoskeletal protein CcmA (bactofilin family)
MFWKKRTAETAPAPPVPTRRFTDSVAYPETVLGGSMRLVGEIQGADSVRVAGVLEGKLSIRGLCHVGEGARVIGRVTATHVVVEGQVEGKLHARRKVELRSTSKVEADIHAHAVAIADGCHFDGRIRMEGGEQDSAGQQSFQEKRRRLHPHP